MIKLLETNLKAFNINTTTKQKVIKSVKQNHLALLRTMF